MLSRTHGEVRFNPCFNGTYSLTAVGAGITEGINIAF